MDTEKYKLFRKRCINDAVFSWDDDIDSINDLLRTGASDIVAASCSSNAILAKATAAYFDKILNDLDLQKFKSTEFGSWRRICGWRRSAVRGVKYRVFTLIIYKEDLRRFYEISQ